MNENGCFFSCNLWLAGDHGGLCLLPKVSWDVIRLTHDPNEEYVEYKMDGWMDDDSACTSAIDLHGPLQQQSVALDVSNVTYWFWKSHAQPII